MSQTKVKKEPKDRLGQAVVSLITGIFSIFFLLLAFPNMNINPGVGAFQIALSFILALIGFVLGIRARKSPKGRGLAIAGITLTVVPFILGIIFIPLSILMPFFVHVP
ncbi:hypothetical protein [Aneurinibacillus migulanus]|uniref:hypothetical protein n=1 Tax=Aneurinibacillus migulanus TaxID=47500 RepID=UPI00209CEAA0|nr:hypothetical protein [Aneurinibacillus migulanus]MCP1358587.1 hypothetical protein [Aneurinibacillus migulanus]